MTGKGIFIAFEGIDGAGKSTQASDLADRLKVKGYNVTLTREPSDSPWGKKIRESGANINDLFKPIEQLALFVKDRREHVERTIIPALIQKKIVITDRYYFSTIAYQGAMGVDIEYIKAENNFAPIPDIVFYIDISPEEGIRRIREKRGGVMMQYEKEDYLKKVKTIFDSFKIPNFYRIDAEKPRELISKEIDDIIETHLKKLNSCKEI